MELHVAIVAPSSTMSTLGHAARETGFANLRRLGVTARVARRADHATAPLGVAASKDRVADIHDALDDPSVDALLAVFGGYHANQLLDRIDWARVARAQKPLIGYSDVTALLLAWSKAGAPSVHGPAFATFSDPNLFEYTSAGFVRVLSGEGVTYRAPAREADDLWFLKPERGPREERACAGWRVHRQGIARGPIYGGNLETLTALAGTPYLPDLSGAILFVEDTTGRVPGAFHRSMTQLRQIGVLAGLAGLVVGAFPRGSAMDSPGTLEAILDDVFDGVGKVPVLTGAHCSHVDPMMTLPLGARAELRASAGEPELRIEPGGVR